MTMTVLVTPIDAGWTVQRDPGGEPLVFASGGRAEAAAEAVSLIAEPGDPVVGVVELGEPPGR